MVVGGFQIFYLNDKIKIIWLELLEMSQIALYFNSEILDMIEPLLCCRTILHWEASNLPIFVFKII